MIQIKSTNQAIRAQSNLSSYRPFSIWNLRTVAFKKRSELQGRISESKVFPDFHSSKTLAQKLKTNLAKCLTGWWLNQPPWKICSSNWIIPPGRVENKKYLSCHHLVFKDVFVFGATFCLVVLNGAGLPCLWCVSWTEQKDHQFFVVDYILPLEEKTQGLLRWNFNTTFKKLFFLETKNRNLSPKTQADFPPVLGQIFQLYLRLSDGEFCFPMGPPCAPTKLFEALPNCHPADDREERG